MVVNGIKAVPYHAGLDNKQRVKNQDMFLMEDVDVVVAQLLLVWESISQIVRFVIHHDIQKALRVTIKRQVVLDEMVVRAIAWLLCL
ncbi:MAG: hypothetical protein CM15mP32_3790 [Flavobacteriaceae bacterium]|nr:MAG: hypothetical protein CM15mP32_3790 [Flavobacteriaceae bacterium]